jgi:hypothetical protein
MFRKMLATTGVAALVLAGGLALAGSAGASINNGQVYTSNGEAGWFTSSAGTRIAEVHADVITTSASEQAPSTTFTTGNGVGLCANASSPNVGAQLGEVWNSTTLKFDVVWAEGKFTGVDTPDTNGTPCTDAGALPVTLGSISATDPTGCMPNNTAPADDEATTTACGIIDPDAGGIPVGNRVYLKIAQWNTHLQFVAEDDTTGLVLPAPNEDSLTTVAGSSTPVYAFVAEAGTTFDSTNRSAPASTPEAYFSWVRAASAVSPVSSSDTETEGKYFSNWSAESVISTPSGSSSDPALVAPTLETPKTPGGLGCFTMYVGAPTGM